MAALSKKLRSIEGHGDTKGVAFWCPGCDGVHAIYIARGPESQRPLWTFDGNVEAPTFSPSILVTYNGSDAGQDRNGHKAPPSRCHSFVRAGNIEFLSDCTHALAGKTVPLPDWPYAEGEYGGV